MQLSTLFTQYARDLLLEGKSPRTVDVYQTAYKMFLTSVLSSGAKDEVTAFNPDHLKRFMQALFEGGNIASTVNTRLSALKSFGEWLKTQTNARTGKYYIDVNPIERIRRPKQQRPERGCLSPEELRLVLAEECPPQTRLAVEMVLFTSARVSEIAGARVRDLVLDGSGDVALKIVLKGGRERIIGIVPEIAAKLEASLKAREVRPEDPLLVSPTGRAWTRTSLSGRILALAVKAGVSRLPVRAHILRHSATTIAHKAGADEPTLAAMLGHSDTNTVHRYRHLSARQGDVGRKMVYAAVAQEGAR